MKNYFVVNENGTELQHIGIVVAETTEELNAAVKGILGAQYNTGAAEDFAMTFEPLDINTVLRTHSGSYVFDVEITEDRDTDTRSIEIVPSFVF